MHNALAKLVRQCDKNLENSTCPIIEILQGDSESRASCQQIKRRSTQIDKTSLPFSENAGETNLSEALRRAALEPNLTMILEPWVLKGIIDSRYRVTAS